jgi:multidrug transporter EmrE-like cation transporter
MRQGLGVGRALIAVGSVLALLGCFLPWLSAGELSGQVMTANGLNGTGLLVFVASIGMLLLVLLPYASSSGSSALDRPLAYAVLAGIAILGLVIRVVQLWSEDALNLLPPDRALGLWLAIIGVVLMALGVGDLLGQKPPAPPLRSRR